MVPIEPVVVLYVCTWCLSKVNCLSAVILNLPSPALLDSVVGLGHFSNSNYFISWVLALFQFISKKWKTYFILGVNRRPVQYTGPWMRGWPVRIAGATFQLFIFLILCVFTFQLFGPSHGALVAVADLI